MISSFMGCKLPCDAHFCNRTGCKQSSRGDPYSEPRAVHADQFDMKHRYLDLDGVRTFYREAGAPDAPAVLLPHGYPSSSFQFRNLLPKLADRWRVIAPDFPGYGYSDTPPDFAYTFDGYADFFDRFMARL